MKNPLLKNLRQNIFESTYYYDLNIKNPRINSIYKHYTDHQYISKRNSIFERIINYRNFGISLIFIKNNR